MSLIIHCECGKKYRYQLKHAGRRLKCKICARSVHLPIPDETGVDNTKLHTREGVTSEGWGKPPRPPVNDRNAATAHVRDEHAETLSEFESHHDSSTASAEENRSVKARTNTTNSHIRIPVTLVGAVLLVVSVFLPWARLQHGASYDHMGNVLEVHYADYMTYGARPEEVDEMLQAFIDETSVPRLESYILPSIIVLCAIAACTCALVRSGLGLFITGIVAALVCAIPLFEVTTNMYGGSSSSLESFKIGSVFAILGCVVVFAAGFVPDPKTKQYLKLLRR